jgi:hypothetical protein
MGIKKLFTFTKINGLSLEKLFNLVIDEIRRAGKHPIRTVGIDMSNWIYARLNAAHKRHSENSRSHGSYADYSPHTFDVAAAKWDVITGILALLEVGITPICVFDGLAPYSKMSAVNAQKDQRSNAMANISDKIAKLQTMEGSPQERQQLEQDVSRLKGKYLSCPMSAFYEIAEFLGVLNITCLWAKSEVEERAQYMKDTGRPHPIYIEDKEGMEGRSEADQILSALYPVHIDAVMSSDTDFLGMGCDIIIMRMAQQTIRERGKDIRTSVMYWTYIEADKVWDQIGFTLYPLIPRTAPIANPDNDDEFVSLNSARADSVSISALRNSFGPQSMKQLKLITRKMLLTCALASCPGVHMRKPSLAVAARAAEEGLNIPDTIAYIDKSISAERNKKKCYRCYLVPCICEKYGSNKTIVCTMLAYLTFTRLPYEYMWFRHVQKTRTQWLPSSVPGNSWSLMSYEYIDGNIRNRKQVPMRIGSVPPTNCIDIELLKRFLPRVLPNMLCSRDMEALLSVINSINDNIARCVYLNRIDRDLEEITMNNAVYAEHRLPSDFNMPIHKAAEEFNALFTKQQEETSARRTGKGHRGYSSSDVSPYVTPSPITSSQQDDIPELDLASGDSFSSISSLDDFLPPETKHGF